MKSLVKILIGAAWLDGKIQPEEREYLHQIAAKEGLANDPDIQSLVNGLRTVQPTECYQWVRDYLGDKPNTEDYHNLLEAISGLIYRDGEVAVEEAKLLTKLQSFNPADAASQHSHTVLKEVQKLYRRWIDSKS